jgi:hypothetical protein
MNERDDFNRLFAKFKTGLETNEDECRELRLRKEK